MNRRDFQRIAQIRMQEADALLKSRNYSGAYYLCGYAVECGLKACIAKLIKQYEFPNRKTVNDSYSHDLVQLVRVAGLNTELDIAKGTDPNFELNWTIAKDWSEESRYRLHRRQASLELYNAIADPVHGVLPWIERYW